MGLFRVLLAVSVFMAHCANPKWIHGFGGENAVEIFFVISGFYIALILDQTYTSTKRFYLNRLLRLYPIYFVVCGLVLLRALFINSFWMDLFNHPKPSLIVGGIANSTLFGTDWMMFLQWRHSTIHFGSFLNSDFPVYSVLLVPQAWSLGIEVTFYLFAPLICKMKTRNVVVLGGVLTIAKTIGWVAGLNVDPWTYRFFPFELPLFIFGILLYRIRKAGLVKLRIPTNLVYALTFLLYLIFGILSTFIYVDRKIQFVFILAFAAFVILCAHQNDRDRKIGEYSYPFYISHLFVISSFSWLGTKYFTHSPQLNPITFSWAKLILMFLLTLIGAKLLLIIVSPLERLRDRNRGTTKARLN